MQEAAQKRFEFSFSCGDERERTVEAELTAMFRRRLRTVQRAATDHRGGRTHHRAEHYRAVAEVGL